MIHKIIDNSIPEYMAGNFLETIIMSDHWRINRDSKGGFNLKEYCKNPYGNWEPIQPTIDVLRDGNVKDPILYGYAQCIFDLLCCQNNIVVNSLDRILINANYKDVVLKPHIDNPHQNAQSLLLMLTPFMNETGFLVEQEFIPYEFCRTVWFDSKDFHTATVLTKNSIVPRITVSYSFQVPLHEET